MKKTVALFIVALMLLTALGCADKITVVQAPVKDEPVQTAPAGNAPDAGEPAPGTVSATAVPEDPAPAETTPVPMELPASTGPIALTEEFTWNDPEDLAFAGRFVLISDENTALPGMFKDIYGIDIEKWVVVIYADENGFAVGRMDAYVCADEDYAVELQEVFDEGTAEWNVLSVYLGPEETAAAVAEAKSFDGLEDETAKGYVAFLKETKQLTDME